MASKKKNTPTTDDDGGTDSGKKPTSMGRKDHHDALISKGGQLLTASRPRGKPYILEEWLLPGRRYGIAKVLDGGGITMHEESAAYDNAAALNQ